MSIAIAQRPVEFRSSVPAPAPAAVVGDPTCMAAADVDDATLGRAIRFGLTGGTVAMFLVTLVIGLGAGLALPTAAAVAVWPGIVSGLYFGGALYLGRSCPD